MQYLTSVLNKDKSNIEYILNRSIIDYILLYFINGVLRELSFKEIGYCRNIHNNVVYLVLDKEYKPNIQLLNDCNLVSTNIKLAYTDIDKNVVYKIILGDTTNSLAVKPIQTINILTYIKIYPLLNLQILQHAVFWYVFNQK